MTSSLVYKSSPCLNQYSLSLNQVASFVDKKGTSRLWIKLTAFGSRCLTWIESILLDRSCLVFEQVVPLWTRLFSWIKSYPLDQVASLADKKGSFKSWYLLVWSSLFPCWYQEIKRHRYITSLDQVMVSFGLVKSLPMSIPGHSIIASNRLPLDQVATRGSCLFYWIKLPVLVSSRLPWVNSLLVDQVASHGLSLFPFCFASRSPIGSCTYFWQVDYGFPPIAQPLDCNQEMEMVKMSHQIVLIAQPLDCNQELEMVKSSHQIMLIARPLDFNQELEMVKMSHQIVLIARPLDFNQELEMVKMSHQIVLIAQPLDCNQELEMVKSSHQIMLISRPLDFNQELEMVKMSHQIVLIALPLDCNQEMEMVKMSHQIVLIAQSLDCNQEMEMVKMSHQIVLVIRLCLLEVLPTRQVGE
ncbi:hypothetical protein BC941DRAFT_457018 [Chlamydoabsidia padenii]|nr:hypothetical protein BC941DRAFT_457018 [Chlamydoabsidia padenii]